MVVTLATSVTIACGDAAVDSVTAPKIAAKPATPVAEQYPYDWEVAAAGIPSGGSGIQIDAFSYFEPSYETFVVTAHVTFQWSNDVSAMLDGWLLNKEGQTVNLAKKGLAYSRLALPVPQGDTTLTVRVSTNNITCGLVGKGSYAGSAAFMALDTRLLQIKLSGQTIHTTTIEDVLQPACPPADGCEQEPVSRVIASATVPLASSSTCLPALFPPTDGNEDFEVCYTVWRELWIWDYFANTYTFVTSWIVGMICYVMTMT